MRVDYTGFRDNRRKDAEGYIYFLLAEDTGLVKIGFTVDPGRRIRALQTSSPVKLTLLGKVPGDRWREERFHLVFRDLREHGEWFRLEGKLKEFIERDL